ncbi:uncharacterized protein LOC143002556 [Genypterus blacodes]|uniref:uncharacterized protein LOC143002556 n=1 Tax=Genypterus blacodes TaxID=154954 RepID=UPI003F773B5D
METCSRLQLTMLKLIFITLLPALQAQKIMVQSEVTGYLGHDVTLPCQFIKGAPDDMVTQVQWDLLPPEEKEITMVVSNGVNITVNDLKTVEISGESLVIREVKMSDAGVYRCTITTYPRGPFRETMTLVVAAEGDGTEQMPLSSGVIAGIVIAIMLLLVIMAVTAYLIIIRKRHKDLVSHTICMDTSRPAGDVARSTVMSPEESLVYADVRIKQCRYASPSSDDKHSKSTYVDDDDITYSHVAFARRPFQ